MTFPAMHILLQYYHPPGSAPEMPVTDYANSALIGTIITIAIFVVFIGWFTAKKVAIFNKKNRVGKFIRNFKKNDPFWDEFRMRDYASEIFLWVQTCYRNGDFRQLQSYITPELFQKITTEMEPILKKGYGFHYAQVEIENTAIVGAEDHSHNDKDSFSISYSGTMRRYVYSKRFRLPIDGHSNEPVYFTDIYHFIRRKDQWILSEITTDASLKDVLKTDIEEEKPGKPDLT